MNLARGFRRLCVVTSIAVLGMGLTLDVGRLWSHAKIYATLDDGRTEVFDTWHLVGSPPYDRDPATRQLAVNLVRTLPAYPMAVNAQGDAVQWNGTAWVPLLGQDPLAGAIRMGPALQTFRVVRGPAAWSREDLTVTPIAAGAVALLWAAFFAARWVARGFSAPKGPAPSAP
jgi:hypothetical protein